MRPREFTVPALLVLAFSASASENAAQFAGVGLSKDAQAVMQRHIKAWFGDTQSNGHCVRGEPEPWLKARSRYAFRRVSSTEAAQTIVWPDGANITVMDVGCEYYTAAIRYVFPVSSRKVSVLPRAAEALRKLRNAGAKPAFDLEKAERELRRRKDLDALMRSHDEIPVPGDGEDFLQTRIVLHRAGIESRFGFVELTLLKGPL